jgi:hypothetical protein
MSQHRVRRVVSLAGIAGGFGGAFDLNLTPPGGGTPIPNSVQESEMAVTGTFQARAGTLLDQASQLMTTGMVTTPYQTLQDGQVVSGGGSAGGAPAGWSPDPSTWGSPMDAVAGAQRTASNADQSAIDANLEPGVTNGGYINGGDAVDGHWIVNGNGEPAFVTNGNGANGANGGMKWWHWGLIGAAVLGGGYALTRVFAR